MKPIRIATLTVGDSAPDFSGIAVGAEFADGKPFRLSDYFDEQIVLYFYPNNSVSVSSRSRCGGQRSVEFCLGRNDLRSAALSRFCRMTFS